MGIQPIRKTVVPKIPEIPDKLYFRIGDVAKLCEVPAYVLRFWETEFPQLKPNKGGTGQRLYRKRDVEMALRIKSLLYDQGYTIPGARQVFKTESRSRDAAAEPFTAAESSVAAESFAGESFAGGSSAGESSAAALPGLEPQGNSQVRQALSVDHALPGAANSVPAPAAATAPGSDYDAGAEVRRQVKLHALRAELQSLLELLVGGSVALALTPVPAAIAAQPIRPRLMLEPRQAAPKPAPVRAETLRLVTPASRDLPQGE